MEGGSTVIPETFPEEPTLEDAGGEQKVLDDMLRARESGAKFFELIKKDDWEVHTDKNGVLLETRPYEGSDLLLSKVTTEVNVSATNALKAFRDFGMSCFKDRIEENLFVLQMRTFYQGFFGFRYVDRMNEHFGIDSANPRYH